MSEPAQPSMMIEPWTPAGTWARRAVPQVTAEARGALARRITEPPDFFRVSAVRSNLLFVLIILVHHWRMDACSHVRASLDFLALRRPGRVQLCRIAPERVALRTPIRARGLREHRRGDKERGIQW